MLNPALFTSDSGEWATPPDLFQGLSERFGPFDLDPAATAENAKCVRYFTKEQDGLRQRWEADRIFLNPPYGRGLETWARKCYESTTGHNRPALEVIALLPFRPDTNWWHSWVMKARAVYAIRGRVRFVGAPAGAPFPSCIVRWDGNIPGPYLPLYAMDLKGREVTL